MKRKRGFQKGYKRKQTLLAEALALPAAAEVEFKPPSSDNDSAMEEDDNVSNNDGASGKDSPIEIELVPTPISTPAPVAVPVGDSEGPIVKAPPGHLVYGRVKVKLKTTNVVAPAPATHSTTQLDVSKLQAQEQSEINQKNITGPKPVSLGEKQDKKEEQVMEKGDGSGNELPKTAEGGSEVKSKGDKQEERKAEVVEKGNRSGNEFAKKVEDGIDIEPNGEKQEGGREEVGDSSGSELPKKVGGIKIKPKSMASLSTIMNQKVSSLPVAQAFSRIEKKVVTPMLKEVNPNPLKLNQQNSLRNKQELNASLAVIRKIMKMDASEPFNVPVNPVALGIPDYFDVIKNPMDFGTVCTNIGRGKYKNSKDVYNDVEYIWENCYRYNNKGDYILDLMKRVKKNFMKYWTAAGLYTDNSMNGSDNIQMQKGGLFSLEGTPQKPKVPKHVGLKAHKDGCMCAICVMKRRKRDRLEREGLLQPAENQIEISDGTISQDYGQELENEDATSNFVKTPNTDPDTDMEELENQDGLSKMKQETQIMSENDTSEKLQNGEGSGEEESMRSGFGFKVRQPQSERNGTHPWQNELQANPEKSVEGHQQAKIYNDPLLNDNPMILELCETLFPNNSRSIWRGPKSLACNHGATRKASGIHSAIAALMK